MLPEIFSAKSEAFSGGTTLSCAPNRIRVGTLRRGSLFSKAAASGINLKTSAAILEAHVTGSGNLVTLRQVAIDLCDRLISLFLPDEDGYRPCFGEAERYSDVSHWQETIDSIRQCNDVAGDADNPDTVAFLGWDTAFWALPLAASC